MGTFLLADVCIVNKHMFLYVNTAMRKAAALFKL